MDILEAIVYYRIKVIPEFEEGDLCQWSCFSYLTGGYWYYGKTLQEAIARLVKVQEET